MSSSRPKFQNVISKLISAWMIIVIGTILALLKYEDDEQKAFYRFGPNKDLIILGFCIDNKSKYIGIVTYCFVNSLLRTLYNSVLHPWLINNIQDETRIKPREIHSFGYEVTIVTTTYMWFDWFIYMNILLSQVDMVLIEISADVIMSLFTTMYYLNIERINDIEHNNFYNKIENDCDMSS